ncbi:MAG: hypothetical protein N4J56_006815 [Chroococcidiopsis sp. SAG 2025]|uniref:hypothetical protein n=1 Tax=Chroococcidiopsis sp. SAG 2025 TaxID=171389 RepID=UPI002937264D|nr:hypothetical protein [Chroococcidiopsis sp. SAG 2025]MDV2997110.1 hypothetical protein [Chroococcidiopsis sp. SAG 2025]
MLRSCSFIRRFIFLTIFGFLLAILILAPQIIQANAIVSKVNVLEKNGLHQVLSQANSANLNGNSAELIISDMQGQHESRLQGVPDSYDWSQGPRIASGNNPGELQAITGWGIVNEAAGGNPATNTRVEISALRTYLLRRSNNQWLTLQDAIPEGAAFREDFTDNANVPANVRKEPQGTISVKAGNGFNFHFWPRSRAKIDPEDIAGIFVTFRARLIVDNPNQADDRGFARYLALAGADYWSNTFPSNRERTADAGIGKAKYVTGEWRYFNMTTASPEVLKRHPPPLEKSQGCVAKIG